MMYIDNLIKVDERVGDFLQKFCGLGFCSRMTVLFGMELERLKVVQTLVWYFNKKAHHIPIHGSCTIAPLPKFEKHKKQRIFLVSQLVFQKEKIHQDTATHCHSDFDLPQCPPWHPWNPWLSTMDVSQSEGANGSAQVFVKWQSSRQQRIKNRNKNQFEKGLLVIFVSEIQTSSTNNLKMVALFQSAYMLASGISLSPTCGSASQGN